MAAPEIDIDVDPATGIWRTDNLPMVYLPRHFLVNNHRAVEDALGIEAYRTILRAATEKSALHWCEVQARTYSLNPEQTFRHYFNRLSQRGWGRFVIDDLNIAEGRGRIALSQSVFALEFGPGMDRRVCYMFEGFMIGAFRYVLERDRKLVRVNCQETRCAAHDTHDACRFDFSADNS
ncbi:MAG: DUF5943 domain-containing protein [Dongiaceae bacterium]